MTRGTRRILLTGGGTGGHVYPALAVAARGRDGDGDRSEFLYVGTSRGLERDIVEKAGLPFRSIDAGAVRGRSIVAGSIGIARTVHGIIQARRVIGDFQPDVVLATGGFVCVPVVLAARAAGVPTVVYLPDLRPGWAVRFLSRVATAVAVSFEDVRPHIASRQVYVTGYPVRPELLRWNQIEGRRALSIPENARVVLVMGGSRGAQSINEAIRRGIRRILAQAWVIHATGVSNFSEIERQRAELPEDVRDRYRVYPYLDEELAPAMASATLVICRAGASTLGELPAVGLPGLLVPYPHAGAHQRLNAEFLAARGAVETVDDETARTGGLVDAVLALLERPDKLAKMAEAARRMARPDAADQLLRLVSDLADSRVGKSMERLA